ncbi:hypothetical protein BdWA1_000079 [Babesia duncani]|uniref:Uncharacterized protein n=1 Tax=Babesia duncani TaxID=323732 RepID=A0AAD9UPN8_9APIC|nr:hypothetical protein BdWA1_000079 [Babesia duncani]
METQSAILADVLDALPLIEERISTREIDLDDAIQVNSLRITLDTLERLTSLQGSKVISGDAAGIGKRIGAIRQVLDHIDCTRIHNNETCYLDAALISRGSKQSRAPPNLQISTEFDQQIEEWAEQVECTPAQEHVAKVTHTGSMDLIKGELAQLADSLKSKALWYRNVLVKDNKALNKYTSEHERQLDTAAMVADEASKLSRASRVSFKQSIIMVASMLFLFMAMMMLFLVT